MKGLLFALLLLPAVSNAGYIGGSLGQGRVDDNFGDISDNKSTAVGIFAGKDYGAFALEAGYTNLGEVSGTDYDVINGVDVTLKNKLEASSIHASVLGKLPIGETALFARAGVGLWSVDVSAPIRTYYMGSTMTFNGSGSDTGFGPVFGVGVIGDTGSISMRMEYTVFGGIGDGVVIEWPSLGSSEKMDGGSIHVIQVAVSVKF